METHVRRRILLNMIGVRSDFLKSAEEGDQCYENTRKSRERD